jgi:hypothetical protein
MKIFFKTLFSFILFWALVLSTAACQLFPSEPTPEGPTPVPVQVTGIVLVPPTLTPSGSTAMTRSTPTAIIIPTIQPSLTPTPTPIRLPVTIVGTPVQIQIKTKVSVFFSVNNPNPELAASSIPYQVTAFDKAGSVIATHSAYIYTVLPGETQPVADSLAVKAEQQVAKIDVQLKSHRFETTQFKTSMFSSTQATFYPAPSPFVTGIIKSRTDSGFYDLKVTAILYDANETIVGGGYTYLNRLPGDGQSAVKIYVQNTVTPARIELSSTLTSTSLFSARNNVAESAVELLNYGFTQTDTIVSAGIVAQNTLNDQTLERAQYRIVLYDANDIVLDCAEGYFNLFFPGEKMGTSTLFYLAKGQKVARVETQLISGSRSDYAISANPFQIENVKYLPGTVAKVSAIIKNAYPQDLTNIEVNVVAYDQNDKIIGGGRRYANLVPANGQTEIEVPLNLSQAPARLEFYTGITSLTKIGK